MRRPLMTLAAGISLLLGADAIAAEPADAKQLLKDAATEVSYLSFEKALAGFGEAQRAAAEGSEDWQAAVFGQAICLQQMSPVTQDNLQQSEALYTSLIERHPDGKFTPQSMMAMGRIDELVDYLGDEPRRAEAREWYEKARTAAGENSDLAHEATLRIASTYVQSYDIEQCRHAMGLLEDWLAKYPKNPLASAMWQYAGETWFWPIRDEKKAIECYLKAVDLGLLEKGREGPTYWRIAILAERNELLDTAIAFYTRVITETPTSGKAYESQLALKRLGAPVPPIELFEQRRTDVTKASESENAEKQ